MMTINQSIPSTEEYSKTAKQMMDRVTSDQPEEVKERVKAVQKTATKVASKNKDVAEKVEDKAKDIVDQ